jgi:hypothetical protein
MTAPPHQHDTRFQSWRDAAAVAAEHQPPAAPPPLPTPAEIDGPIDQLIDALVRCSVLYPLD